MSLTGIDRYIGIVADGSTDQDILSQLAKCLIETNGVPRIVSLAQKLRDPVDAYWRAAAREGDYGIAAQPARELVRKILLVLELAFSELQAKVERELRYYDLLIVNTDAEKQLPHRDGYFQEWCLSVPRALNAAIETFYHNKTNQGYRLEYLVVRQHVWWEVFTRRTTMFAAASIHL